MEEEDRLIEGCAEQAPRGLLCAGATVAGTTPEAKGVLIGQHNGKPSMSAAAPGRASRRSRGSWTWIARRSGAA